MDLNSARIFAHVVAKGSFSGAALSLGIPVATVSRRVSELETALNVRLIERSTRKLRLTDAGATLYEFVSRGVEEMEQGLLALVEREQELKGRLRFSMPPSFEPMWSLIERFQSEYSQVDIEVLVSERRVDFIEDGIDVALRVGNVASLSAVARTLVNYRHKLVGCPSLMAIKPLKTPKDLHNVPVAAWGKKGEPIRWSCGDEIISLNPFLRSNDYMHMRYLARQGKCVTELPPFFCKEDLESGKLVELLPEYPLPEWPVSLVYPSRRQLSRVARAFIDYCITHFEE